MAWTVPTVRATGELITASIWNTDLTDNLKYLKGLSGGVALENDLTLGTGKKLTADEIYAGG